MKQEEITRARMKLEALISRDAAKAIDALVKLRIEEYEKSKEGKKP